MPYKTLANIDIQYKFDNTEGIKHLTYFNDE